MESEIAAVDALKSRAIHDLQELAAPEKKIVRVRVASILETSSRNLTTLTTVRHLKRV